MGIDPDTKKLSIVEAVNTKQKKPWVHTIPLPSSKHQDRAGFAFRGVAELIYQLNERDGRLPIIYMEAPIMGIGGPGATIPQCYIQGAVMAAASEFDVKVIQVNNQTWKKRICGNGGINKADIPAAMKEVWPELIQIAHDQQDLIDAGAIYLFGRRHQNLLAALKKKRENFK